MKIAAALLSTALLSACAARGSVYTTSNPPPRRQNDTVVVRNDGPARNAGWVELAAPQINEDHRDFITVGADAGEFQRLRFDVTRGSMMVKQILIEFGNGETQRIRVDRPVAAGEAPMDIDLKGRFRGIKRIVVYVEPSQGAGDRGVYRVFGS